MPKPDDVSPRAIEEAALRAWPAAQQLLFDGWVARLSDGYTKRANSALLLYPQSDSLTAYTVSRIESLYQSQSLPVIFRLLSFTMPHGFAAGLISRGYRPADPTLVMARKLGPEIEPDPAVRLLDIETGIEAHARMNNLSASILPGHRAILERITSGLSFVGLFAGDDLAACGLSVVDGPLVGLFDIVTDLAHRRKGYGARLVRGMLADAAQRGATTAYLQVIAANAPAITLYRSLGFEQSYSYDYRILDR
jgi:ribosomal protein S18 acetylase RimI-like enzyme